MKVREPLVKVLYRVRHHPSAPPLTLSARGTTGSEFSEFSARLRTQALGARMTSSSAPDDGAAGRIMPVPVSGTLYYDYLQGVSVGATIDMDLQPEAEDLPEDERKLYQFSVTKVGEDGWWVVKERARQRS